MDKGIIMDRDLMILIILNGALIVIQTPFYMQDSEYKIQYFQNILNGLTYRFDVIYAIFTVIVQGINTGLITRLIRKHEALGFYMYHEDRMAVLKRVKQVYFAAIFSIILFFIWIVLLFFGLKYVSIYRIIPVALSLLTFYLGFVLMTDQKPLMKKSGKESEKNESEEDEKIVSNNGTGFSGNKYNKSGLSKQQAEEYYRKLISFMEKEKPYTDIDLSLRDVCSSVNISRNNISFLLNNHGRVNFYDFVNRFRIDHAKGMLINNDENGNMLEIARKSGFKSKSTFNKSFRKFTGLSPSEFIRKHSV